MRACMASAPCAICSPAIGPTTVMPTSRAVSPPDTRLCSAMSLTNPSVSPRGARPVARPVADHRHPHALSVRAHRLLLGEPDVADLGLGEGDPRDDAVVEAAAAAARPEGVAGGHAALLVADVRELQRGWCSRRPPRPSAAARRWRSVRDVAVVGERHAGGLQPEAVGRRGAADRDQQVRAADHRCRRPGAAPVRALDPLGAVTPVRTSTPSRRSTAVTAAEPRAPRARAGGGRRPRRPSPARRAGGTPAPARPRSARRRARAGASGSSRSANTCGCRGAGRRRRPSTGGTPPREPVATTNRSAVTLPAVDLHRGAGR